VRNSPVSQETIPRSEPPAAAGALAQPTAMPNPHNLQYPGIAVVELFTSEGCSSCPSADATLARVAERAERAGRNIFPVELHVDYWDYLGWRDPFDDARYSERQATYRALSGSTYTPQAVVNGLSDCAITPRYAPPVRSPRKSVVLRSRFIRLRSLDVGNTWAPTKRA
jgi:hypothetical protein